MVRYQIIKDFATPQDLWSLRNAEMRVLTSYRLVEVDT